MTPALRLRRLVLAAALIAAPAAAFGQAASPAAMRETMAIGDEPGRVSTEEVIITEGPFARQLVYFRSSERPGTLASAEGWAGSPDRAMSWRISSISKPRLRAWRMKPSRLRSSPP